jgi:BMFP domain-containing protein YqiC
VFNYWWISFEKVSRCLVWQQQTVIVLFSTMTKSSKIIDDLAQLAGGAAGLVSGVQQQIRDDIKTRMEEMAANMDLIPREEFERLEVMLQKALTEQEALKKRLDKLENK